MSMAGPRGGVILTEDQYADIMGRLLEADDLAQRADVPGFAETAGREIAARLRHITETLEQEHYPVVPEPDDGNPF